MTEPEIKDAVSVTRNRRTDAMFVAAFGITVWLVYLVVYEPTIGQYAQGVVTMVLAMFLAELKSMYSYETGTTRSNATKDATLARIAEESAPTSAAAAAASVAAVTAAVAPAPPIPLVPVKEPDPAAPLEPPKGVQP
jgi:hypothetical protein